MRVASVLFGLSALASTVLAHGALVDVKGANGVSGIGIGVDTSTPRDGTRRKPFQQDSSIIRDKEIEDGEVGPCGRTLKGGPNDIKAAMAAVAGSELPTLSANGEIQMTLHQVNGDGAGPYTCDVSTDGGATFQAAQVTTQVPGTRSRSRAKATDFPLVAQVGANTTCAGGADKNACIVRCRNSARAGPFGGCVLVSNGGAATPPPAGSAGTAATVTVTKTADGSEQTADTSTGVNSDGSNAATTVATAATSAETAAATADSDEDAEPASSDKKKRDLDEEDEDEEDEEAEDGPDCDKKKKRSFNSRIVGRRNAGRFA